MNEFEVSRYIQKPVKRAFCTRRADLSDAIVLDGVFTPNTGDLVLAEVLSLGQHSRIELCSGRRSKLFIGDKIIVSYGNRYAPDQFEAYVPNGLEVCSLVTSGGVCGTVARKHTAMGKATQIKPLGLLGKRGSTAPLNLRQFTLPAPEIETKLSVPVIVLLGASMNSGKTTAAAHTIKGLKNSGLHVSAGKATGTGSGADFWHLTDAGADVVMDFSDCGMSSTFLADSIDLQRIFSTLIYQLSISEPDVIIIEIADGLLQRETALIIDSIWFRDLVDGIIFAAPDPISISAGIQLLRDRNLPVIAGSGLVTASPLSAQEAQSILSVPVLTPSQLENPDIIGFLAFGTTALRREA